MSPSDSHIGCFELYESYKFTLEQMQNSIAVLNSRISNMSLRCFIVLAAFLAFAAVFIGAEEEPESQPPRDSEQESSEESSEELEADTRNPALAIAVRVLATAFRWAAKHCLQEAAHQCKHTWKHAHQLVNCARNFLESNRGRCALG